jgi:hypothetical protein
MSMALLTASSRAMALAVSARCLRKSRPPGIQRGTRVDTSRAATRATLSRPPRIAKRREPHAGRKNTPQMTASLQALRVRVSIPHILSKNINALTGKLRASVEISHPERIEGAKREG